MKKMGAVGAYHPPKLSVPGTMNMPRRGRVGKVMPSPKIVGFKRPPPSKR